MEDKDSFAPIFWVFSPLCLTKDGMGWVEHEQVLTKKHTGVLLVVNPLLVTRELHLFYLAVKKNISSIFDFLSRQYFTQKLQLNLIIYIYNYQFLLELHSKINTFGFL